MFEIRKATKKKAKLRILLEAASGGGKTYSGLRLMSGITKNFCVIDSERGSSELYTDKFDFDIIQLEPDYTPERYIEAIETVESAGYEGVIIDSITHEWSGQGGCLQIHEKLGGRFQDWKTVTPRHQSFIDKILSTSLHVVCTVRAKTDYSMDQNTRKVIKQGLAPQQRDGIDFEMTSVFSLNQNHLAICNKDRTNLFDGKPEFVITEDTGKTILDWLNTGEDEKEISKKELKSCKTLEELQQVWNKVGRKFPGLSTVKDEMKKELTKGEKNA